MFHRSISIVQNEARARVYIYCMNTMQCIFIIAIYGCRDASNSCDAWWLRFFEKQMRWRSPSTSFYGCQSDGTTHGHMPVFFPVLSY